MEVFTKTHFLAFGQRSQNWEVAPCHQTSGPDSARQQAKVVGYERQAGGRLRA